MGCNQTDNRSTSASAQFRHQFLRTRCRFRRFSSLGGANFDLLPPKRLSLGRTGQLHNAIKWILMLPEGRVSFEVDLDNVPGYSLIKIPTKVRAGKAAFSRVSSSSNPCQQLNRLSTHFLPITWVSALGMRGLLCQELISNA